MADLEVYVCDVARGAPPVVGHHLHDATVKTGDTDLSQAVDRLLIELLRTLLRRWNPFAG